MARCKWCDAAIPTVEDFCSRECKLNYEAARKVIRAASPAGEARQGCGNDQ